MLRRCNTLLMLAKYLKGCEIALWVCDIILEHASGIAGRELFYRSDL